MKKNMMHSLLFFGLFVLGCQKEPLLVQEPPQPNPSKLEIIWQKPMSTDTVEHWIIVHDARGNKVLYSTTFPYPAKLQVRDAQNGELKWNFNEFLSPSTGLHLTSDVFTNDKIVVVEDAGDVYAINYNTGERWWHSTGTGWPLGSNQIGGDFYTTHQTGSSLNITSSSIVRTHFQSSFSGWDTLYTQNAVPDSFPLFSFPVLWTNTAGDSLIVFYEGRGYNGPPPTVGRGKTYLTALNLRTRQVVWQYPDFKGYYLAPPLVDGDRLYINGPDVFCFDLNTGNLLWQKPFEGGVGGTSLVVHQDILVVQSSQIGMWGINKYTGDQIWYNKDTDGTTWELILFDGIVYCTSSGYGRLYAVNAETGATIWKEQSPNRKNPKTGNASFANAGVAIDPERRLLYTADKYYVMCIKLPER